MSTYEAGQVYVATVGGMPNIRVMRVNGGDYSWRSTLTAYREDEVTDIRPLVVLDLDYLRFVSGAGQPAVLEHLRRHVATVPLADQIEAQMKPPRIPEPGLWGVVEAVWDSPGINGIGRAEWMHVKGGRWQSAINPVQVTWECLIDPVLVRDGIKDES